MKFINEGRILRVIDGDTVIMLLNLGYETYKECRIRLMGVNTPEIRGEQREEGLKSKEFVNKFLNKKVIVTSDGKKDKYGRWLCKISINGQDLTELLIREGLGEQYPKWFNFIRRMF
jgi:micrococcal nuclease